MLERKHMSATNLEAGYGRSMRVRRWREALLVIGTLALPNCFTSAAIFVVIWGTVAWQRSQGMQIAVPDRATITAIAFGFYAVGVWISVGLAWRWAAVRRLIPNIFAFRRPTALDGVIVIAGFLAVTYGAPAVTRWIGAMIGPRGHGYPLNLHQPLTLALLIFSSFLTAPIGEEILFRGLLVVWLQRLRCPTAFLLLLGSILFACIHLYIYGVAWSVAMGCFGCMLLALRLWRDSLTPCWLIHVLFNMRAMVIFPLFGAIARIAGI